MGSSQVVQSGVMLRISTPRGTIINVKNLLRDKSSWFMYSVCVVSCALLLQTTIKLIEVFAGDSGPV